MILPLGLPMPSLAMLRLGAAAVAAVVLFGAGWSVNGWRLGKAAAQREAQITQAALDSTAAEREKETLRRKARDRSLDNVHAETVAATRAATDADRTAERLRQHIATLAAERQAGRDPTPLGSSATAGPAILVHADVLGWLEQAGREAAAALQRADIAGRQCAAEYNAVRAP